MALPEQLFRRLLKELRPLLAREGFRRKSQTFIIESPECWGMINFQKSLYSPAEQKNFTINLAIAAKRIMLFHGESAAQAPRYYAGHWVIRIGELLPGRSDRWWTLSDEHSYDVVATEVTKHVIELAGPLIRTHISEEGLLALWDGKHFGGFEYPVLKHKSILLAERGELEKLPAMFDRIREICRGSAAEAGAEEHIVKVRRNYLHVH